MAGGEYRPEMEVKTSFSKASRIPETVSTLINEEFVLVHQKSEDTSGNDEKPQLKVCCDFIFKCVVRFVLMKRVHTWSVLEESIRL